MNLDGLATCERLHARIPAAFCAVYRKTHDVCRGCRQAEDMDTLAEKQPQERPELKAGGAEKGKPAAREDDMGNKPIRACKECGEKKSIHGRGLCGKCYARVLKAEKDGLDEKARKHDQV
jgi:hypothetical protein